MNPGVVGQTLIVVGVAAVTGWRLGGWLKWRRVRGWFRRRSRAQRALDAANRD